MHPLLGSLEDEPPAAGQDRLERLLDGRLDPVSVPPADSGLARLLAAMTAPAAPDELAGERLAMATFAAVMRSHPPTHVPRRAAVASKVFTMKAAAAALVAVLSVGGVAVAATGRLPGQASPVADQAPATTTAAHAAPHGLGRAAVANTGGTVEAGSTGGQGRESAAGPDATATARAGLCRAWQAGQGSDHGRRRDSVAFQALVAAAGGAGKVAAYCADVTPGPSTKERGKGQASPPSSGPPADAGPPPDPSPPADPGPPADAGSSANTGPGGHGQSGPPPE